MLVEVTFVRDARSISQVAPETVVEPDNVIAGVLFREPRAVFVQGIAGGGAGPPNFIELADVPHSYVGAGLKQVTVNATEDGLDFTDPPAPSTPLTFSDSIVEDSGDVTLENDTLTPGIGKVYGTDGAGVRGWQTPPSPTTLPDFVDSILESSGEVSLQNDLSLPGNSKFYGTDSSGVRGWQSQPAAPAALLSNLTFGLQKTSGVTTGKLPGYWTCPFGGTISAWNITVDAGTITVKLWKIATGTAHPTSSNSINTTGISLATGTAIHSTALGDFTTLAVAVGDIFAVEVVAVSGVTDFGGSVEITRS